MRGNTRLVLAALGLMAPLSLQSLPAQDAPSTDILKDAIEPYIPGRERARFLKAAGADTELEQSEFTGNAEASDPFVRKYDKWPTAQKFDRNANGTLDWFEADTYRRALRQAVVAKYDKNGNTRLDGEELIAAAEALAKGEIPAVNAERPQVAGIPNTPTTPSQRRGQGFGFGGDFNLPGTYEERQAQFAEARGRILQQFDSNGDGTISETERAAMPLQRQWESRMMDLAMTHFDEDGDGKISEAEEQGFVAFAQEIQKTGQQIAVDVLDLNGDGQVDGSERQAVQQKMQAVAFQLLPKLITVADTNGDGTVDPQERQAGIQRVSQVATEQIDKYTERFDANNDGRLDATERTTLIQGVRQEFLTRIKKFDSSNTGKLANLTPAELANVAEDWFKEIGILGAGSQ